MPRVRVKNATKEWYAELLDRVHVPLPTADWERLRDLAKGDLTEPSVPRRKAVQIPERSVLAMIVQYGKPDASKLFASRHAHEITPRFMRRLWAQVFAQCPRIDWHAETKSWKVAWGEHAIHDSLSASVPKVSVNHSRDNDLEAG